jgi:hypothetical protein
MVPGHSPEKTAWEQEVLEYMRPKGLLLPLKARTSRRGGHNVVPEAPVEQVDVVHTVSVEETIIPVVRSTFEAFSRSEHSNDNSWTVDEHAEVYWDKPREKEMYDGLNTDWNVNDTPEKVEKYSYQSIDDSVYLHVGFVGDYFWGKKFYYYDYVENMKRSVYGRQQGLAAMDDDKIHEQVGQEFSIKLFETNAQTGWREKTEAMKSHSTLSNEEELARHKSGKRENNRAPGAAL